MRKAWGRTMGVGALATAMVLAAAGVAGAADAGVRQRSAEPPGSVGAQAAPPSPTAWEHVGGDMVVDPALGASPGSAGDAPVTGPGYQTFDGVTSNLGSYTFRLTSASGAETVRPRLEAVAAQLRSITGGTFTVASGTVTRDEPIYDEILVSVSSSSPCGASGWAGCGGPRIVHGPGPDAGRVWIHPTALGYSATDLQHVVTHEIGHALGLQHYASTYNGAVQVMHPSDYTGGANFGSGDSNGLRFLYGNRPVPANDPVAGAFTIDGDTAAHRSGSNVNATLEGGEPAPFSGGAHSIWYRWDADRTGFLVADTIGSTYDTTLAVYRGAWPTSDLVSSDDDSGGDGASRTMVPAIAGETYWFRVDGWNGAMGWTELQVELPTPLNDDRSSASTIDAGGADEVGSTRGSTQEDGEPLHGGSGSRSIWYRFEPSVAGRWVIDTTGSDFDTVLAVYPDQAGWPAALAANDDTDGRTSRVDVVVDAGTPLLVAVSGYQGTVGTAELHVHLSPWSPFASADRLSAWSWEQTRGWPPSSADQADRVSALQDGRRTTDELLEDDLAAATWGPPLARVARLYWAFFLRPPDTSGLRYWLDRHQGGTSLATIAQSFATSAEFRNRYGSLSNAAFVDRVYANVLGRAPDAAGRAYWIDRLASGTTRGQMMVGFSESAEYRNKRAADVFVVSASWLLLGGLPSAAQITAGADLLRGGMSRTDLLGAMRTWWPIVQRLADA